jgi:hypothetical protein
MDLETSLMLDHESTFSTPRWVKMIGVIIIALLVLLGSLHVIGRSLLGRAFGGHGDHAPHSGATEHGPQQP